MTISISIPSQPVQHPPLRQWYPATWEDYMVLRDASIPETIKLAFNQGALWVDMGREGINHASVSDLFTMLFGFWASQHPEKRYNSFGRCLLEKPPAQACAPDLVLYVGDGLLRRQQREPHRIDLSHWRVPRLVGEISDTTLASDLDEQKHLYAALGIPEYWVIDIRGQRVFAFQLNDRGEYESCTHSKALAGLPIALLEQTLERLPESTNTAVASWFAYEITKLKQAN